MRNFTDQLDELKTLLSFSSKSNRKLDKSSVYSTLLQLQEHSTADPSLLPALADSSHILLSSMAADISDENEEVAAQALKCLGFMIYQPSIVLGISGDDANMVLSSLQKVILATRIKSVCNLGVWCISIQQFSAASLNAHVDSLVIAIVHALDNPIGSLSTTFEAIQAVMKLATQLNEKMRERSNLWAPPIYRRLVSAEKREKDMAERCLLKVRSMICPPPIALSKAVAVDIKRILLPAMKALLEKGMKIQIMQAWGWYTRLIGLYAMKNRHLINELLKIPEHTFPDTDPQVQIVSLVAWEALIDALIIPPTKDYTTKTAIKHGIQQGQPSGDANDGFKVNGLIKSIRLIMTPLTGIMSSKCDLFVHFSCMNTWNYLLYKLDASVNCPSVIQTVLEPILEVVFRVAPDSRNLLLWRFCVDLIDTYALVRRTNGNCELDNQQSEQLSDGSLIIEPLALGNCLRKHYPIKWMPWNLSRLDFFLKMIQMLISHKIVETSPEIRSLVPNAALRIFRSVMQGVQCNLKSTSVPFDEVMSCINTIITSLKKISEGVESEGSGVNGISETFLCFIEIATEELEQSTLGSPLYKLVLDQKYIENYNLVNELRHVKMMVICSEDDKNMVSPLVYFLILYFRIVVNLAPNTPQEESLLQKLSSYVRLLLASYDHYTILHALTCLLYKYLAPNCLHLWIVIANCLHDYIGGNMSLKLQSDDTEYLAVCHFLAYPFAVFSSSSQRKLEIGHIVELWKSLYISVNQEFQRLSSHSFCESFCSVCSGYLEDYLKLDSVEKAGGSEVLSLCGDAVICVLEQILKSSDFCQNGSRSRDGGEYKRFGCVNNVEFAARFLSVSYAEAKANSDILDLTSRVFSTLVCYMESFHSDKDIIPIVEIISIPLIQWLSDLEVQNKNAAYELQQLWIASLKSLQMSWPPITFNSTFLKFQAPVLEITIDHPNSSISEPTIAFWNSTYGKQMKLDYPQSLLPVLDKLSRNGKIKLCRESHFKADTITPPPRYKVTTTLNRCVKRVELLDNKANTSGIKRKRLELTEHQKEVRRAQQGRLKDCQGRGPGIRTYTSIDFSQGNEDESQEESQDFRNAESILEMLKQDAGKLF